MTNLISIVVPVYNVEPYLRQCLDSIREQTYETFEAILVDDGSTDNSGAICDEYAGKDARFTVIHQENRGLSGARNTGLRHCRGQFLSLIDSDDWIAPDFLAALCRALEETDADVALCDFIEASDSEERRRNWPAGVFQGTEILREYMDDRIYNRVFHKLYRMETVSGLRFPEYRSAMEDAPWQAQVMTRARRVTRLSDALYYYRIREGSIMRSSHNLIIRQGTLRDAFGRAECVLSWLSAQYAACQDDADKRNQLDEISASAFRYVYRFLREFIIVSALLPDSETLARQVRSLAVGYDALPVSCAQISYERQTLRFFLRERSIRAIRVKFPLFELRHNRFLSALKIAARYLLKR